jgi:hypothetical protein
MSAPEILQFVIDADCYPNVSIAYRILLTVPVSMASAERSFLKLKLFAVNYVTRKRTMVMAIARAVAAMVTSIDPKITLLVVHQDA